MNILLIILCGTILSGIWFGLNIIFNIFAAKMKLKFLERYSVLFSALLPTILILQYSSLDLWKVASVKDWKSWLLVFATVVITAGIVSRNEKKDLPEGRKLFQYAVDGIIMEVPQRMMMQSFLYTLLLNEGKNVWISSILTAVVWCISICIQCVIMKQRFNRSVVYELLASFVFSTGVGYALLRTEFVGFTMVAHFLERLLSTWVRNARSVNREVPSDKKD